MWERRAGTRAVDLGGPSVYQGGPKFEIKQKSRCLQKSKLVNWRGQAFRLGRQAPLAYGNLTKIRRLKCYKHRNHNLLKYVKCYKD